MENSEDFLTKQAQTNPFPFLLEIDSASGVFIRDKKGKSYFDMTAGVAVNNIGHCHPKVISAIQNQLQKHLHVMVYGEYIQDAQLALSKELTKILPSNLNCIYPVNSGAEANEAAIKLVKRTTNRHKIITFKGGYHGSTIGALSVSGNENKKRAFRPLMPGVETISLNKMDDLGLISKQTAGVILETIQGDAGVQIPSKKYIHALRKRCSEVGAMLIFDEIQCGIGRTAKMFAFEHFEVVPDVLTLGKGLGGGMSIGVMASSKKTLHNFTNSPMLGHITTFGGHPISCSAAAACLKVIKEEVSLEEVEKKGEILEQEIGNNKEIICVRRIGLMLAFDMISSERVKKVVDKCFENGVLLFWFLSHPNSFRISPPLTISFQELNDAIKIIVNAIEETK
ncbi:MAG: aspartate aminotransferase family protein [Crocinitomicaceae bacterium]|nr:aspartate aminotransferase family protein [Crocinitomicaceae bacterium]